MARFDLEVPADLDPALALLVGAWKDGAREWLDELGDLPAEAIVQRHGANGVSIGALLLHMIDCDEGWIRELVLGQPQDPASVAGAFCAELSVDDRKFPDPPAWTLAEYVALLKSTREQLVAQLVGLSAEEERTSQSGNVFTLRWVLAHLVQHDSYHGGQIVLIWQEFGKPAP